MNAQSLNRTANKFMNSLIPVSSNIRSNMNIFASNTNSNNGSMYAVIVLVVLVLVFVGFFYYFQDSIANIYREVRDTVTGYFETSPPPAPEQDASGSQPPSDSLREMPSEGANPNSVASTIEKILPGGPTEVFNVSSNKFTYYDAEPLCKALGAELATYDQVKAAWSKGADWCNYGWIKGQMAVYPTSEETYKKLQGGPEDQQLACGRPGVNGGFFDNPELRYGVNCYGSKPAQSKHDEARAASATPMSPDALEFDKKVVQFKSEADTMGIMPFNGKTWA